MNATTPTPFFPAWRARLAPLKATLRTARAQPLPYLHGLFGDWVPEPALAQASTGPNSRKRKFPLNLTFWAFLGQILNPGTSCREAVRQVLALFCLSSQDAPDEQTSGYCQARLRLPLGRLQLILGWVAHQARQRCPRDRRWRGREVKVVDGTTVTLPDTSANQKAFPQPRAQKPGCGFPILRCVGLFSLTTGCLLTAVTGNYYCAELSLFRCLWHFLKARDVLVADRHFSDYGTLAWFWRECIDCVIRLNEARPADFRRGCYLGPGDGTGIDARFNYPKGVAVDSFGNLFVADTQNQLIREITSAGVVSTLAGLSGNYGEQDGIGENAKFFFPYGITIDSVGNLYVTDTFVGAIRKVTSAGVVTTLVQSSNGGYQDGTTATALFHGPDGITIDKSGNLYVVEGINNTVRRITTNGVVSTVAGRPPAIPAVGTGGFADGLGTNAIFFNPTGIAVDSSSNLYVADTLNAVIRKITPLYGPDGNTPTNWLVTTLAGQPGIFGGTDGVGPNALFGQCEACDSGPSGIAVDGSGSLFVTDSANNNVREITPAGVVTTVGGLAGTSGSADGTGSGARFNGPAGITVDAAGNLYVVDSQNDTIRKSSFTQFGAANVVAASPPVQNSSLTVTMLPAAAGGQWRFPWEVAWHNSGDTETNLVAGNYPVEFQTIPGWLAIPSILNVPVTGTSAITNLYYQAASTVTTNNGGTLTINLGPNPPAGASWGFLGTGSYSFPSGFSTNVAAGTYLIAFAPVSGRVTPPNSSVQVQAGQTTYLSENYLLAQAAPGGVELPVPVPAANIPDCNDYPFGFDGQLESDTGYGSGEAVTTNVVLTAAHEVFNDNTLSYVSQAYWFWQEETGVYQPEPLAARGWYVLSGYAAQRTNDLEIYAPGTSTPQSRKEDVAALYFLSPAASGGCAGYLPSDASPNTWLTSEDEKLLVSYPVDGSQLGDASIVPGEMYQTEPNAAPLVLATDPVADQQVYTATWFLAYPGSSGGSVCVQYDGYFYPAGVYLGSLYNGIVPYASAVRAIDSAVVNLITNAAALGDLGTNNTGGGVVTIIAPSVSVVNPAYLWVQMKPPAAVAAGAAWQLVGGAGYSMGNPFTVPVLSTNAVVQFKPVPGWLEPTNQTLAVTAGQIQTNLVYYTATNPVLKLAGNKLGMIGTFGTAYALQSRTSLVSGAWSTISTNMILTNGFNLLPPKVGTNGVANFYRLLWLGQ